MSVMSRIGFVIIKNDSKPIEFVDSQYNECIDSVIQAFEIWLPCVYKVVVIVIVVVVL